MLRNKIRTESEIAEYLAELKRWQDEMRDLPVETMRGFFKKRLEVYEDVHRAHWGEVYACFADYFDGGTKTLLDLGCGTGLELESLYRRFPELRVTGIDLSPEMLGKLKEKYAGQSPMLVAADYFSYPFGEERFDAAASFETLHHFRAEKKAEIYRKLFKALKPGGIYVECDYVACSDEEERICLAFYEDCRRKSKISETEWIHVDIPLTKPKQIGLLREAGFGTVETPYENCGTVIFAARKP